MTEAKLAPFPDWSTAPTWATALAQNENGTFVWFENLPIPSQHGRYWTTEHGRGTVANVIPVPSTTPVVEWLKRRWAKLGTVAAETLIVQQAAAKVMEHTMFVSNATSGSKGGDAVPVDTILQWAMNHPERHAGEPPDAFIHRKPGDAMIFKMRRNAIFDSAPDVPNCRCSTAYLFDKGYLAGDPDRAQREASWQFLRSYLAGVQSGEALDIGKGEDEPDGDALYMDIVARISTAITTGALPIDTWKILYDVVKP